MLTLKNTNQKPPKRQHVIPECYLKRFAEQNKAWVTDLESDSKPYKTGIDNILCVKDFYTIDSPKEEKSYAVEQWLSKGETKAEPFLSQLLDQMKIPEGNDKTDLSVFLATLYLRGPWYRRLQLELYESSIKWFSNVYFSNDENFENLYNHYVSKHGPNAIDKQLAKKVQKEAKVEGNIATEGYVASMLSSLPMIAAIFNNMDVTVWWGNVSDNMRFVTGDFPFVFEDKSTGSFTWPTYGLMDKRVRIYFPVSSLVCITLEYSGVKGVFPITHPTFIPILNSQLGISTSRYIVSRTQDVCWFKQNKISFSINDFHREFRAAKKDQPLVKVNDGEIEVTPRPAWGKLKGDIRGGS